jgi:DNA methylase
MREKLEKETVLDPMMGFGTTGLVTLNLRRKFIGIDKNLEILVLLFHYFLNYLNYPNFYRFNLIVSKPLSQFIYTCGKIIH